MDEEGADPCRVIDDRGEGARSTYARTMALRLYHVSISSTDPRRLGRFWASALGQNVLYEDDDEVLVGRDEHDYPGLCFLKVPEEKAGKNRLHLDLDPDDQLGEIARLLDLGATRADVGQGSDATWVVLADPEGNEFCVLRPHRSLLD
jgi:catechol 2,3-dioxygenase-like lactoylglutathione lyase family enzyme